MEKLYLMGDIHFGIQRDWDSELFNNFINWFEKQNFGKKEECELIQLGDVVERASNLGDTLEMVTRFFNIAINKFKSIYIIGGNHDHKMLNNRSQYATKYLTYLGDNQIKTIYKEEIFHTQNGFHILALPYRRVEGKILDDYYSNDLPEEFYKTKVDLVCGHVAIKEIKSFYGGINIDKFKAKKRAFGHIHSRIGVFKDDYCGSVVPLKINEEETELPRIIKCYDKKLNENNIEIPIFVKYDNLIFGSAEPRKLKNNIIKIYTVKNCKNILQAKSNYPNTYIKGVEKIENKVNVKTGEKIEHFISPLDALDRLISETKLVIKRKTLSLLKTLLE